MVLQGGADQYLSRRREFEVWLSKESELLSWLLSTKGATLSDKELKIQQDTLKVSEVTAQSVYKFTFHSWKFLDEKK